MIIASVTEYPNLVHRCVKIFFVQAGESIPHVFFAQKNLNNRHPRYRFLQKRVNSSKVRAYSAESLPAQLAESQRYKDHHGKSESKKQRKSPIHPEQDKKDADKPDSFVEKSNDDRCEHLIHVLDIVCVPGNQPAYPVGAEKREVQPDDMVEQTLAQRVHHSLTCPFEGDNLEKIRHEPGHDNSQEKESDPGHPVQSCLEGQGIVEDIFIDGQLDESRPNETCACNDKGKTNCGKDPPPLGNHEFEQPPPQLEVAQVAFLFVFQDFVIVIHC
jgi:hypothetical protein